MQETKSKVDKKTLIEGIARYLNGLKDGEVITKNEKLKLIGIDKPDVSHYKSTELYEQDLTRWQLKVMGLWEDVRDELLKSYSRTFRSVRGDGYQMLTPKDQLNFTISDAKKDIKKVIRKGLMSLKHIRTRQLTSDEQKRASDEAARLSMIRGMLK